MLRKEMPSTSELRRDDMKRGRSGAQLTQPSRWAAEVAAGEQLDHQRDTTEGAAVDVDSGIAQTAYGGGYFLEEAYLSKLSRQHRGGPEEEAGSNSGNNTNIHHSGGGSDSEKVEVFANPKAAQPAFFTSGHDFPAPVSCSSGTEARNGTDGVAGGDNRHFDNDEDARGGEADLLSSTVWAAAQNADMDVILPVVDPNCSLALSASKGSHALAELRRLMAREKTNRDVMDTSKSDLAGLLKKDGALGQVVVGDAGETVGLTGGDGGVFGRSGGAAVSADEAEEEGLRRKIRLEEQRQAALNNASDTPVTGKPSECTEGTTATQHRHGGEARQQAKSGRTQQIRAAQDILAETVRSGAVEARLAALREHRRSLPIHRCRSELMRYIGENPVTVVVGDTGSGKTTQLVQYLYEAGYASGGRVIGCTQPRRLAAMGVARRVSEEVGCALGSTVGYSIHLDDMTTGETQIKFMTDGVLLREVVKDPSVNKYSVIVLDEAHERSVDTDVLMGVLKLAVRRRGDLKLIVTSATMDIHKFSAFFGNAPFYEIPGQTFDVDVRYAPALVSDYIAEAVFRVCQLHLQAPLEGKHDILVFMTGRDDVHGTCELIRRRLADRSPTNLDTLLVLPCLSEAASLAGDAVSGSNATIGVLDPTPPGKRKCVVATNVAETSLTIDGVRYVVDCGFMKTNVFRPKIGMNTLQRYPVSQAQAGQRKGRAGRTTDGVCFRLYTEEQYQHEMLPNSVPEIQRSSIDSVVLLLKSIGVSRIANFDFMDPPPAANTRNSMWHLWLLGLLDTGGAITPEGRLALEFPMSPALAKLLLESTRNGCSLETARIVALITVDPRKLFELPKGREEVAQQHHGRFHNNESDHLTLLNAFTQFLANGKSWQWAQDHFLHAGTLLRACDVLDQLIERMHRLRLPVTLCGAAGYDKVRFCIAQAFCLQAAQRSGSNWNEYRPLLNLGVACTLYPGSSVCARAEMPPFVIYNDLLLVSAREYLVMVTAVEPEWLVAGGHGLYSMRRGGRAWRPPPLLVGSSGVGGSVTSGSTAAEAPVCAPSLQPGRLEQRKPPTVQPAGKAVAPASRFGLATGKRRQNI